MSSLALTAENWEPCVHITQGMVRAKGLEGSEIEKPLSVHKFRREVQRSTVSMQSSTKACE